MHRSRLTRGFGLTRNEVEFEDVQPLLVRPLTFASMLLPFPFHRKVAVDKPWWVVSVPMAGGVRLQVKEVPGSGGTLNELLCPSQARDGVGPVILTTGSTQVLMV